MGGGSSKPNETQISVRLKNSKFELYPPTSMPSKLRNRIDTALWNEMMQLFKNCELTWDRHELKAKKYEMTKKGRLSWILYIIALILWICWFTDFENMALIYVPMIILFIGLAWDMFANRGSDDLYAQWRKGMMQNARNLVKELNTKYSMNSRQMHFGAPELRGTASYDNKSHTSSYTPNTHFVVKIEVMCPFVRRYIGGQQQIAAPAAIQPYNDYNSRNVQVIAMPNNEGARNNLQQSLL